MENNNYNQTDPAIDAAAAEAERASLAAHEAAIAAASSVVE